MRITNISATIESETVEDSGYDNGARSSIVHWSCHLTGDFTPFLKGEPQTFMHSVAGRTPDEAWENMLRDLEASGVEL